MKKIFAILAFAAMTMTVSAQSLEGNWQAEKKMGIAALNYILTFKGDQVSQSLVATAEKEIGIVTFSLAAPAQSYTPGKTLNFTLDASKVEMKITDIKFNDEVKAEIKKNSELEKTLRQFEQDDVDEKKELTVNQVMFNGKCTITNQTAESFELKNGNGETYNFKKVK